MKKNILIEDVVWTLEKLAISYARQDSWFTDGVENLPSDSYNRGATHSLCHAIALLMNSRNSDLPMNDKQKTHLYEIKEQVMRIANNMNRRERERATLE